MTNFLGYDFVVSGNDLYCDAVLAQKSKRLFCRRLWRIKESDISDDRELAFVFYIIEMFLICDFFVCDRNDSQTVFVEFLSEVAQTCMVCIRDRHGLTLFFDKF